MDLEEPESAVISLEFNPEDRHPFVEFASGDLLHMSSGGIVIPPPPATRDKAIHEGNPPSATLTTVSPVATAATRPHIVTDESHQRSPDNDKIFRDLKKKKPESNVNQSWFTGKHAKESFQEQGHSWKQGMWSKEEVDILMKNIEEYVKARDLKDPMQVIFQLKKEERKDFYRTIAAGLNRPLFAVYRRVQRMYDSKNYVGKYSEADIERLKGLRATLGNDWAQIGAKMGRSASSVKDKCRLLKETCQQGKWRFDEEQRLTAAVYEVTKTRPGDSITGGIPWQQVAEKVVTRTEKQCRAKWLNYLNWKHTGGTEWNKRDDDKLLEKMRAFESSDEQLIPWHQLAAGWKSVRSPQWLRSKWWSLKRTIPNYQAYSMPDLVDQLQKLQRKQPGLRCDVFPVGLGQLPFKIARMEVPNLDSIKNKTLLLHLPLTNHSENDRLASENRTLLLNMPLANYSGDATSAVQLGLLTETLHSPTTAGTSSGQLLLQEAPGLDSCIIVQSVESLRQADGRHRFIVQSVQPSGVASGDAVEPPGLSSDHEQVVLQSVEPSGGIPIDHRLLVQSLDPPDNQQRIVVHSMEEPLPNNHQLVMQSLESHGSIVDGQQQLVAQSSDHTEGHQMVVHSTEEPLQGISESNHQLVVHALESQRSIVDGQQQLVTQPLDQESSIVDNHHRIVVQSLESQGRIADNQAIVVESLDPEGRIIDYQQLLVQSLDQHGNIVDNHQQLMVQSLESEGTRGSVVDNHQQLLLQSLESQRSIVVDHQQLGGQCLDPVGRLQGDSHQLVVQSMDTDDNETENHQMVVQSMDASLKGILDGHGVVVQSVVPGSGIPEDGQMLGHDFIEQHDHQVVVESVEQLIAASYSYQSGAATTLDGHSMAVAPLQDEVVASRSCPNMINLCETASDQLIIASNQQEDERSHDSRSHDDEDSIGVSVQLHDASDHQLSQSDVDRLTSEMSQSEHTDGIEDSRLSNQSQLIGTDAVLSSQQEVTSSELQVVPDSSTPEDDKPLSSVQSAPPSEGLMVQAGGQDNTHLDNSVFTLSGSLLSCQSDHAYLMEPPTELEGKTKLPISTHS